MTKKKGTKTTMSLGEFHAAAGASENKQDLPSAPRSEPEDDYRPSESSRSDRESWKPDQGGNRSYGDRPNYGDRGYGDRNRNYGPRGGDRYGDRGGDRHERTERERSEGDQEREGGGGGRSYGDRGDRGYGDRGYGGDRGSGGDRGYGNRSGDRSYGDRGDRGDRGGQRYGNRSGGDRHYDQNRDNDEPPRERKQLNLLPRTVDAPPRSDHPGTSGAKSNPFGDARPREEVLKTKGIEPVVTDLPARGYQDAPFTPASDE
eukprot:TRINITY_DN2130_c0_g5_i3.p1 TRINITY_DN2130_c0_g5~~TRINITY_DN2130_c0_g5_i3.p1  ORF type:complete len:260 (-),score=48.87 TRINITY_DN2130_c0_g5_i3:136-915(-)